MGWGWGASGQGRAEEVRGRKAHRNKDCPVSSIHMSMATIGISLFVIFIRKILLFP